MVKYDKKVDNVFIPFPLNNGPEFDEKEWEGRCYCSDGKWFFHGKAFYDKSNDPQVYIVALDNGIDVLVEEDRGYGEPIKDLVAGKLLASVDLSVKYKVRVQTEYESIALDDQLVVDAYKKMFPGSHGDT